MVRAVVLLRGRGVEETRARWAVSHETFGVVSRLARDLDLTLLGTAHTHGRGASVRLSSTDRRHGVRVPDFLAVVIGDAGAETNPMRWGWNAFADDDFHEFDDQELEARVTLVDDEVESWKADATEALRWDGGDG